MLLRGKEMQVMMRSWQDTSMEELDVPSLEDKCVDGSVVSYGYVA